MAGCSEHFIQSPFTANRHPDHTSYKKYKDVFDERRRITCFRISPHALMYKANISPRTDAELNSA